MASLENSLVLVTGASGDVGSAYLAALQPRASRTIGIHRSTPQIQHPGVEYRGADLTSPEQIAAVFRGVAIETYDTIALVHPVGKFAWEEHGVPINDRNSDGIDDDVFDSNVNTFTHIIKPLLQKARPDAKINIACFGSLSDRAAIPFWHSYTASKNELRARMRGLSAFDERVATTMVNLPSVNTRNENSMRPHADKTYWMNPDEIAVTTADLILRFGRDYREIDRFVQSPEYYAGYYNNHAAVYARWKAGMNG